MKGRERLGAFERKSLRKFCPRGQRSLRLSGTGNCSTRTGRICDDLKMAAVIFQGRKRFGERCVRIVALETVQLVSVWW